MSKVSSKVEQEYQSQGATFSTELVNIEESFNCSCQINLINSSSFSGSSVIQVSNDLETWVDLPNSEEILTDCNFYDIQSAAAFVRVKIVFLSGSADFNIDWLLL
jgi:CRISPR/Cas system CMR-associated protein Cmr1 (group 7 of RAMP superfamily)